MKIETVKITKLEHDSNNSRQHGHHNIEAIKESLRRWGQQKPIVVDDESVVIAGNGTLAAARELGWTQIQVVRTDLDEAEKLGFAIADNRTAELAEWDEIQLATTLQEIAKEDMQATGFSVDDLDKILGKISRSLDLEMPHDEQTKALNEPGRQSRSRLVQLVYDQDSISVYYEALKGAEEVLDTENPADTVLIALQRVGGHEG